MLYNVVLQVEATDSDEVKGIVEDWVIPGSVLMSIASAYPENVVDLPHEPDPKTDKIPKLKESHKPDVPPPIEEPAPPLVNTNILIAVFTYDPTIPGRNESVSFDASLSDGNITEYRWDFGDTESDTGVKTDHKFTAEGDY